MLERMKKAAHDLVVALGITEENKHGQIHAVDAWRYIVKTKREMRQAIALGGKVDIDTLVDGDPSLPETDARRFGVAGHLGVDAAGAAKIKAALMAEKDAFEKHFVEETEKLGEHAHFHEDHGVVDGRTLKPRMNRHTGKPEGNERVPPESAELNHAAFAKVKAGK